MKTRNIFYMISILFLLFIQTSYAGNVIKYYEPILEELSGTVKILSFPGQPNYTSVKEGDADETGPYLILNKRIDVDTKKSVGTEADVLYYPVKNVKLVQLVIVNDTHWRLMKNGRRIKVKGELFAAHTGHHHTDVLIMVRECRPA